ncbi:unnamed protein product [Pocillopora meandrina]|uniref:Fibrinogen C-terminal domain-containing protein n=1 Tax=Pocillopora meandrina TaxID=46732 RepID=A0AAU9XZ60_9CNID|nr:unnamed protein product [Pocillopora meandrina]
MRSIQQGIGSALLFLALSVTFELLSSTCADPVNFQNYTTVHLKGVKGVEVPKQVTNNRTSETPKNCAELYKSGERISGVYTIDPDGSGAFNVYCDHMTAGGDGQ